MRILLALLAVAVVVAWLLTPVGLVELLPADYIDGITIYCHSCTVDSVHNGILYEVSCTADSYYNTMLCCDGIEGIAIEVDSSMCSLQQLVECLILSNTVQVSSYSSHMYGYSATLPDSIIIDSYRINVHIVTTDTSYIVGTPILLGSY